MASGIFAILDDIAALMDDVAIASKIATKKTAAILGDDLAVNAEKATGFVSSRELPVLWAITKGSILNKIIIVPIALLLNLFFPEVIKYILILGGFYLAYEGVEKIIEIIFHRKPKDHVEELADVTDEKAEDAKIKSAVLTDFILSIEIVIIALGTVLDKPLAVQIGTVSVIALIATVGVYGLVALIVRLDDMGYGLIKKSNDEGFLATVGNVFVKSLPIIIKVLGYVGTVALLMVAGGIFDHNIEAIHQLNFNVPSIVKQIALAIIAGLLVVILVKGFQKIYSLVAKK